MILLLNRKFRQFDEKLCNGLFSHIYVHGMLQMFFAIANCIMVCDLTEKLKLQRKFLPKSLFTSKPYRNSLFNIQIIHLT